ncbi:hypothetical protein CJU90_3890 [Yarrowia sp. C11]|nr:hypothetical protein CKK34_5501 [Yarrowia sp. E02]KAG5367590.1 hypothetical protein CJU90_3890 [Yarrowia sp. C11]
MTEIDIDSEESFMSDGDYSGSTATSVEEDTNKAHVVTMTDKQKAAEVVTQTAPAPRPTSSTTSRRSSASINGVPLLGQTKQDVASEVARRIREISQSMDNGTPVKHVAKPEPRKLSLKKRWRDSFYGGPHSHDHPSPTTPTTPGSRASIIISTPTLKQGSKSSALEISKPISRTNSVTSQGKRKASDNRDSFQSDTSPAPPTSAQSDSAVGGMKRNNSVKYGGRRISGPIEVNGTPDFQTVPLSQYNQYHHNNPSVMSLQLSSSHMPAADSEGVVETIEMTSQASHFHTMRRKSDGMLLNSITNHSNGRATSLIATSANVTMENPPPASSMLLPSSAGTTHSLSRKPSSLSTPATSPSNHRLSVQKSSPQLKHKHASTMSIDESTMEPGLALELERRKVMELKRIATNQNVEKLQLVKQAERDRLLFEETEKLLEGQRNEVSRLVQELERMEKLRKEDKEGHLEVIDSLQRAVDNNKVQSMGVTRQAVEGEEVPVEAEADATAKSATDKETEKSADDKSADDNAEKEDVEMTTEDDTPSKDEIAESIAMATAAMQRTTAAEAAIVHLESEINHLRLHRDSLRDALTSLRKSSDIEIKSYRDQCMRLEKRLGELEGDKKAARNSQNLSAANSLGLKRLSSSSALGKSSLFIRNELYQELFDRDADVVRKIHENIEEEEEGRMKQIPENDGAHERRGVPRFITVVEEE